jgi:hypothetical protein
MPGGDKLDYQIYLWKGTVSQDDIF